MLIRILTILVLIIQPALSVGWNATCATQQASTIASCSQVAACCCGEIEQICGCAGDEAPPLTPKPAVPALQQAELCLMLLPVDFQSPHDLNDSWNADGGVIDPPRRRPNDHQAILCIWQT